jgi:hypothetical protein
MEHFMTVYTILFGIVTYVPHLLNATMAKYALDYSFNEQEKGDSDENSNKV